MHIEKAVKEVFARPVDDRIGATVHPAYFSDNAVLYKDVRFLKIVAVSYTHLDVSTSSVQKGESLIDTGKTLDALSSDIVVIRHSKSGAPLFLSKNISAAVVNAGDGANEHPTQALLDFFTMRQHFGRIEGLKVAIIGDVKHSRVARSKMCIRDRL